jgi:autotransporter-associated beta strand protein
VSSNTLTVGTVTDNGSGFSLTKLGAGTLAIGGAASYTGATTVSGGTLACIGSALSSSTISIASGATLDVSAVSGGQTLAASGTLSGGAINGSITDNSGTVIYPGGAAVAGTLTVTNNLTLGANGSGSVTFDITNVNTTGGGVNDLIVVGGTLNIAGPTTINLNLLATPVGGVPYTLFQYGSLADGSLANLTVPTGFVLSTSGNAIQVTVTHIPVNLTWVGDGNYNYWDVDTTADWNAGQFFNLGDYVTFDDTGSDNPSINIEASTVSPSSVTVNATQTYDFIGYGIASGSLLKTNSGTLILENNNTYQGMTTIAGGVLQVGNPNTGGSTGTLGAGAVSNNASLVFGRNDTAYVVGNSISGSGSISMSGNGTVTLNASNTYTGATTVNSGILAVENRSALGSPAPGTPITVNNGGQLAILVPLTNAEPWVLDGSGNGEGALYKTNGATSLGGTITLGPDNPEIYVAAGSTLSLTNPAGINGVSANAILTLAGNGTGSITGPVSLGAGSLIVSGGTWAIAPSNNFSGVNSGYQVEISGGDLQISSNLALGPIPGAYNLQAVILQGGTLETTNNISFTDGNIGFYVGGNSTLRVDANTTLAISNQISGNANLTKAGAGTLALTGSNSFNGNFYVDTTSSSANDGITLVTSGNALANIPATPGTPTIHQGNNNSGYSTLQLNGSSGTITLPQEFTLNCRNNTNANIENIAGNNSIGGNIDINVGGSSAYFQSDAGTLVLAGTLQYQGTLANPRSFTFQGAGNITVSGPIIAATSAAAPVSILQLGTGTLTLSSSGNTYEGSTTISNGTLLLTGTINTTNGFTNATGTLTGTGTINDNVTILPGATVAPGLGGNGSIGTLTMLSNVTLSGIVSMDILDPVKLNTCDQIVGMTSIAYGGTLAVNNLGGTLNTSSTFTLFSASSYGTNFTGNFTNIVGNPGAGLAYSFNPTNGVLSVVSAINTNPPIIGYTYNAGSSVLTLSWATNSGWILQSNSISLANLSDWFNIAGSSNVTTLNITNNKSSPAVFYRLLYP